MKTNDNNTYNKYTEDDQFSYGEKDGKKTFIKQDSEFFLDENNVPGTLVRVKRVATKSKENWVVFVNKEEFLVLRGIRFTSSERNFLRTIKGNEFIISGIKNGWKSVSEFKRRIELL
jgi:hypothetical protein